MALASPSSKRFEKAQALFEFNAQFLPHDNTRSPEIINSTDAGSGILTTDFFGFDTSDNRFHLQGKGDLSEMGDAVLGMVCQEMGAKAPSYTIVRNVSDPEINASGLTFAQQRKLAAELYKTYGRWSSVCSETECGYFWRRLRSLDLRECATLPHSRAGRDAPAARLPAAA